MKTLNEEIKSQKINRYLDFIVKEFINETQFGFNIGGLKESYLIYPWDGGSNKFVIRPHNKRNSPEQPHLKGGYLRSRRGGPNFERRLVENYGLSEDEIKYVWNVYRKIAIKMINDFLEKYGHIGIHLKTIPDTSNFSKNYQLYIYNINLL